MTDDAADAAPEQLSTEFLQTHLDVDTRTIFVSEVEEGSANLFIKSLHLLATADPGEPIHLLINSRGGDLLDAFGMYDAIRSCQCMVSCEVLGHCMSAGVLIAQACSPRLIHVNSMVMMHEPSHALEGGSYSAEEWAKWVVLARKRLHKLFAKHTGKSIAHWRRKTQRGDRLFDAEAAVRAGLFDRVIDPDTTTKRP